MTALKVKSERLKVKAKSLKFLVISFLLSLYVLNFSPCSSFAQALSSTELINNAKEFDGKVVTFEGEVIGDVMKRKDYAWVNLNDGVNAIGIWVNVALLKDIGYAGSYKSIGDAVEVTGVFHRACSEHGGDLDIHAQAVRKTASGRQTTERLNTGKRNLAIILSGVLITIWILTLLMRK